MNLDQKRILITGGAGFIGSKLAQAFYENDYSVSVVDNLSGGNVYGLPQGIRFYHCNIANITTLKRIVKKERPQIISHHAGISSEVVPKKRLYAINVLGTKSLLEAIQHPEFEQFIFASSASAYGNQDALPIPETAPTHPVNEYGKTKLAAEKLIKKRCAQLHATASILRYSNVYGPGQEKQKFFGSVAKFITMLLENESIQLYNHGKCIRDYVHISDVVKANLNAAHLNINGLFNISTQSGIETRKLLDQLQQLLGVTTTVTLRKARKGEIVHSILDNTLARKSLQWSPQITLEEGLAQTVKDFLKLRA